MESVHGHEVLHMIAAKEDGYSRVALLAEIEERFSAEAKFHTCSAEDMSAEQLLDFLENKGKFLPSAQGNIVTSTDKICNH